MTESYMVVQLPKNDDSPGIFLEEGIMYNDYDLAFDAFNERLSQEQMQIKRPRLKHPLRASLSDSNMELWIVKRSDELVNL
jgi:hypothetical protein